MCLGHKVLTRGCSGINISAAREAVRKSTSKKIKESANLNLKTKLYSKIIKFHYLIYKLQRKQGHHVWANILLTYDLLFLKTERLNPRSISGSYMQHSGRVVLQDSS